MTDPRRLIDDPEVPVSIREALAGERSGRGPLDLDAGWAKLRAAAQASAPPPEAAPSFRWLRFGLGVSAIAALGIGWTAVRSSRGDAPIVVAPPTVVDPSAPVIAARPVEAEDRGAPSLPVSALPPAEVAPKIEAPKTPRVQAKFVADDDALREELAQMREIRARLERDPASAFALAEEGQRRFANGHLVEERTGLAVIALVRLGRRDEARARAKTFVSRYPKSTLVDRIDAELAR